MKLFAIHTLLAAAALALAGCSQDSADAPEPALPGSRLRISVTDNGFAPSDKTTRASEEGYTTRFTEGDRAGLFVVGPDGTVKHANIEVTATSDGAGGLVWNLPADMTIWHFDGSRYFLYYPYVETAADKFDPSGTDVKTCFQDLYDSWSPPALMDTYEAYTASDLMAGQASVGAVSEDHTVSLSFDMTHLMALLVLEFPGNPYHITSYNNHQTTCDVEFFSGCTPVFEHVAMWNSDQSRYRLLFKSDQSILAFSGYYMDIQEGTRHDFNISTSLAEVQSGTYKYITIDGGIGPTLTGDYDELGVVRIYDLLCMTADQTDWYLIPQEVGHAYSERGEYLPESDEVIAVVFQNDPDRIGSFEHASIPGGKAHGLAISTTALAMLNRPWFGLDGYCPQIGYAWTISDAYQDIEGLGNSINWLDMSADIPEYIMNEVNQTCPTPRNTSDWFIASTGQWWDVAQNLLHHETMAEPETQNSTQIIGSKYKNVISNDGSIEEINRLLQSVNNAYLFPADSPTMYTSTQVYNTASPDFRQCIFVIGLDTSFLFYVWDVNYVPVDVPFRGCIAF